MFLEHKKAEPRGSAWGEMTAKFGVHVKGEILLRRRRLLRHRRRRRPPSDAAGGAGNG